MLRLTVPEIDDAEIEAVAGVLRSGYLVQSSRVKEFEDAIADRVQVSHAIAVNSGTSALHLALLVLDIGPGDTVLTTTYSWPATANVIELCGARPIFVDIDEHTFNMNPRTLNLACAQFMRPGWPESPKAILPVHAFGQPADMTAILEIASRYEIPVVEDAACALGSSWEGRPAGSLGRLGCFSFHPRKAITTGEGGIVTTNDERLASKIRLLRNHGLDTTNDSPNFVLPGFNYRLTEMGAAIGLAQINKMNSIIRSRSEKAARYDELLAGSPFEAPFQAEHAASVFQSYVVKLPTAELGLQQKLILELRQRGIEATFGTYHIPLTKYYREKYEYQQGDFPQTDSAAKRAVTIPLHRHLTDAQQQYVVEQLNAVFESLSRADTVRRVHRDART